MITSEYIICAGCNAMLRLEESEHPIYTRRLDIRKDKDFLLRLTKQKNIELFKVVDGNKEPDDELINSIIDKKTMKKASKYIIEVNIEKKLAIKKDDGYYCPNCGYQIIRIVRW